MLVDGRVQGVGFRFFAAREAEGLGLRGYARNLPDGKVEVVATGDVSSLETFVERLRVGPRGARVDGLRQRDLEPAPEFEAFTIQQ
jgi:acylphosphatase